MPHYVTLVTFTQEGLKNLNSTTKRAKAFEDAAEKLGVKILYTLWTVGRYDIVHILDAPDDETAAGMAFSLGSLGNVRTETLRAFGREEMEKIIARVQSPFDLLRGQINK
ncbi:MAG: GYD domain-containing protein [Planctomycetota bacterium]|jgi:uncharacterized protein with GYD domain